MDILQIASEITPIAKVGGLGDVLMGLTRELLRKGHSVLPLLPAYGAIDRHALRPEGREDRFTTIKNGSSCKARVSYYHFGDGIPLALLDTDDGFFRGRRTIYGDGSPEAAFAFFCRAAVDWLLETNRTPDVLHIHDWPTALIPLVYRTLTGKPLPSLFTVHNFEYQGRCSWNDLSSVGVDLNPSLLQDPVYSCCNMVKAGLLTADIVTTVSPTYANEVRTPEGGKGLHEILTNLSDRFIGVLNGIDNGFWNPKNDPYIETMYNAATVQNAKRRNREQLFESIGLPVMEVPLIGSVTRLVDQKGIWLISDLFSKAEELDFQGLIVGSVPEPDAEKSFTELDRSLRSKGRGAVFLVSDEELAHKTYAASDLFVVPSLVEPCGLTQLIALQYGAVPVVRRTGGLSDTIIDVGTCSKEANGFVFEKPLSSDFIDAVQRALALYADRPRWTEVMATGMRQDHSWARPGEVYLSLYRRLKTPSGV